MFDGHCHAWSRWPYDVGDPDPSSRGSIDALLHEMDKNDVERAAVVCARIGGGRGGVGFANPDNNEYVLRNAALHPDRLTPWVDVDSWWSPEYHTAGSAARLAAATVPAGVTGFTHYFASTNDGWLGSEDAAEFFSVGAGLGLIASLAITGSQLVDLRPVAAANPTLPICIHHLGVPRTVADRRAILALSEVPNVGVKLSGLQYFAGRGAVFPYADAQRWLREVAEGFGSFRVYWGSDFPASRDILSYRQAIDVVAKYCDFFDSEALTRVMGGNLQRLLASPVLPPSTSRLAA